MEEKKDKEDYITPVAKMCHATDAVYVAFLVFLFCHVSQQGSILGCFNRCIYQGQKALPMENGLPVVVHFPGRREVQSLLCLKSTCGVQSRKNKS